MRHKWNGKLKRGAEYVTCVKCGCMKQRYYGLVLYFTDIQKDPFLKAPDCNMVAHFSKYPNAEIDNLAKLLS